MYARTYVCTYVRVRIYVYVRTYIYIYVYVYTYTYVRIRIYVYVYIYIRTYVYVYTYTYVRTYVRTCVHTYVRIYVYVRNVRTYVSTYLGKGSRRKRGFIHSRGAPARVSRHQCTWDAMRQLLVVAAPLPTHPCKDSPPPSPFLLPRRQRRLPRPALTASRH